MSDLASALGRMRFSHTVDSSEVEGDTISACDVQKNRQSKCYRLYANKPPPTASQSLTGVFAKQVSPLPHCVGAPDGQAREQELTASTHDEPQ